MHMKPPGQSTRPHTSRSNWNGRLPVMKFFAQHVHGPALVVLLVMSNGSPAGLVASLLESALTLFHREGVVGCL